MEGGIVGTPVSYLHKSDADVSHRCGCYPYYLLSHVPREYRKWEEETFSQIAVRCGVPAGVVKNIWALGLGSESMAVLRDFSIVFFLLTEWFA